MSKSSKNLPEHRDFYVYEHRRKSDGRTFYVGKGRGRRAWDFHHRHTYWKRIAAKDGVDVVLLYEGLTERSSLDLEKQIISAYGRDGLCNLTDGGEGTVGFRWDNDQRDGMRNAARLRWERPEYRKKFTASRSGELNANFGRKRGSVRMNPNPRVPHQSLNELSPLLRAVIDKLWGNADIKGMDIAC